MEPMDPLRFSVKGAGDGIAREEIPSAITSPPEPATPGSSSYVMTGAGSSSREEVSLTGPAAAQIPTPGGGEDDCFSLALGFPLWPGPNTTLQSLAADVADHLAGSAGDTDARAVLWTSKAGF